MSDEVTHGGFSNLCYNKMWELFKTPEDEVGSEVPVNRRAGRSITNCIMYVGNVLMYAHEQIGRRDVSEEIRKIAKVKQDGSKLANYLVRDMNWKAHYYNPDVKDPRDGSDEHQFSYKRALDSKKYLPDNPEVRLPISGLIVNYNKTNKTGKRVWIPSPVPVPISPVPIPIPLPVTVTDDNFKILDKFSKVKFAYGIARGATHTFLVSYGDVFEVHWNQEGPRLYGRKAFKDYEWLSGALVIPPDSSFTSDEIKAR